MITEPLGGRRKVSVRSTKTALDLAAEVKTLLDVDYPDAEQVVLVWDNLNTHTPASLYKAFPPAEARRLLNRLEIRLVPVDNSLIFINFMSRLRAKRTDSLTNRFFLLSIWPV